MALDREIPAFAGMGRGVCWFFFGCLRTFCCRVFVFSLPFFSHFHFSRTSIFSHTLHFALTPTPPHPPFPRKRESPCDCPPKAGDSRLRRWIGRFPLSREWGGGVVGFLCRVFADSLLSRFCFFASVFFYTSIFLALPFFLTLSISPSPPLPPTPIPAKAGISL